MDTIGRSQFVSVEKGSTGHPVVVRLRMLSERPLNVAIHGQFSPGSEKDIVCTFFYELTPYCFGNEIMNEIIKITRQSSVKGHDFTSLAASDVEFMKCSGKM